MKRKLLLYSFVSLVFGHLSTIAYAQEKKPATYIDLKNGSSLVGWLMSESADSVVLSTRHGEYRLAKTNIRSMETEGETSKVPQTTKKDSAEAAILPKASSDEKVQPPTELRQPGDSTEIMLKDGRTIVGKIISEDDKQIRVMTSSGTTYQIPKSQLKMQQPHVPSATRPGSVPRVGGWLDPLVGSGSLLFSIGLAYSSDVSTSGGDALSTLSLGINSYVFVAQGVGLGFDVGYASISLGSDALSTLYIGPKIMLAIGSARSSTFPYLHAGYNHVTVSLDGGRGQSTSESASAFKVGFGFLFRSREHVGIPLELAANFQSFEHTTITTYTIGIGLAGFLFGLF